MKKQNKAKQNKNIYNFLIYYPLDVLAVRFLSFFDSSFAIKLKNSERVIQVSFITFSTDLSLTIIKTK